jgi:hypothetical protein
MKKQLNFGVTFIFILGLIVAMTGCGGGTGGDGGEKTPTNPASGVSVQGNVCYYDQPYLFTVSAVNGKVTLIQIQPITPLLLMQTAIIR